MPLNILRHNTGQKPAYPYEPRTQLANLEGGVVMAFIRVEGDVLNGRR